MGARGPKSQLQLCAVEVGKRVKEPPAPPSGMTAEARKLFLKIVSEHKPEVFDTETICLVEAFCEHYSNFRKATKMLRKEERVYWRKTKNGSKQELNKWADDQDKQSGMMNSISTKLRLKGLAVGQDADTARPKRKLFNG